MRPFGKSCLLDIKLQQLKKIVDKVNILVSTSDSTVLEHVSRMGIPVHARDPWYSRNETTGAELYECLSMAVNTEWTLYTTAMCPFINEIHYMQSIQNLSESIDSYDSLASTSVVKQFLYNESAEPLNFQAGRAPRSQDLPNVRFTNFGINIVKTSYMSEKKALVGVRPLWYDCSQLEGIDIDTDFDFSTAELIYNNMNP